MNRDNRRLGKMPCGLDHIIGVHGEIERPARLRRAGERQHSADIETVCNLRRAVEPRRVAGDVNAACVLYAQDKADHIAGQGLDTGRTMARGRRSDGEGLSHRIVDGGVFPWCKPGDIAAKPRCARLCGEGVLRVE